MEISLQLVTHHMHVNDEIKAELEDIQHEFGTHITSLWYKIVTISLKSKI